MAASQVTASDETLKVAVANQGRLVRDGAIGKFRAMRGGITLKPDTLAGIGGEVAGVKKHVFIVAADFQQEARAVLAINLAVRPRLVLERAARPARR